LRVERVVQAYDVLYSPQVIDDSSAQQTLWPSADSWPVGARPTEAAYWRGSQASRDQSREAQRGLGQFMTPAPIARFIARGMVEGRTWRDGTMRALDPAAGSGVLAAALVEAVLALERRPRCIELLLCEIDERMGPLLAKCVVELKALCAESNVELDARIVEGDFLLSPIALAHEAVVDAVIANPPYFKLARRDPRCLAHPQAVHGQPNIYALFMAVCARLLRADGAFGFITPRSWTNGLYFRAARAQLRASLSIDGLHLFDSREAHFESDSVLQEALVTWGTAGRAQGDVEFSCSHGAHDLEQVRKFSHAGSDVLGRETASPIVLPADAAQPDLSFWGLRLADLGLKVVTGPVVGFRASRHLRSSAETNTVPLLWMQHVRRMSVVWPRGHRAEHIEQNSESAWMLLRNEPCILLRRFSPKEDLRRVCAAAYLGELPAAFIGCENHLNVIRGGQRPLSRLAAIGLAAYLNSSVVDAYLRQRLGSTQINAIELRELPVPDLATLQALAQSLPDPPSLDDVDAAVAAACDRAAATRVQAA
jgi:adenine-specific DNA-methyltransferase